MVLELLWGDERMQVDLADGLVRLGGSPTDDIAIEGLPPGLLTLRLEGGRLTATSTQSLVMGASLFPPGVPRLLLEGEAIQLPGGGALRRREDPERARRRREVDTALVARALLAGAVAPAHTRAATLTCVTGAEAGAAFPIAFADSTIGRAEDCDIRILDRSVSRQHARVLRRGQAWLIEDRGTTNGVYVNGARVRLRHPLRTGDIVELGRTMLRFDGPEAGPARPRGAPQAPPTPGEPRAAPAAPLPGPLAPAPSGAPRPAPEVDEVSSATPTEPLPRRPARRPMELLLIGLGAVLAIAGATLTWAVCV